VPYDFLVHTPRSIRRKLLLDADYQRLARASARVFEPEANVLAAYLYGSAARGEAAADLDLAVLLRSPVEPRRLEELAAELQICGAAEGPEIDLRALDRAAPRFQASVLREGRLLYQRDRQERIEREAMLMSCWADFRPTWERMRRLMLDRWANG
jgi:predicted nucleotidyltransferase